MTRTKLTRTIVTVHVQQETPGFGGWEAILGTSHALRDVAASSQIFDIMSTAEKLAREVAYDFGKNKKVSHK